MTKKERERAEELKKLEKAFGRKEYLKSKTVPAYPMSAEREYRRKLRVMLGAVGLVLYDLLKGMQGGQIDKKKSVAAAKKIRDSIKDKELKAEIQKTADTVIKLGVKEATRSTTKTLGVPVKVPVMYLNNSATEWGERAYQSVKDYLNTIGGRVENSFTEAQIKAILKTLKKGPQKISRLSVTDLNGNVSELIQSYLGCDRYMWVTAKDDRVRPCHASFDGKIFKWDSPPEIWQMSGGRRVYTGRHCHPGQDYNCRCVALSVYNKKAILVLLKHAEGEDGEITSRKNRSAS